MTDFAGYMIRACGRHRSLFLGALALLGALAALAVVFRGRFTNDLDRLFPATRETRAVFSLLHDAHLADAVQLEFVSASDVTRHAAYLERTARKLEKNPLLRQVTFRYRSDVLSKLSAVAGADGSPFIYALEDDAGNLYPAYSFKTAKRGTYRYITMIFEEVDLSSVKKLDLIAEYLTEKGEYKDLSLYVYDSSLPLPVKEVSVKAGEPANLPSYTPAARALPNEILLSSL